MLKSSVLERYDGVVKEMVKDVARLLDITEAAVYAWPDVVPLESAQALEMLTGGELEVDARCYPKLDRARKLIARQRA